jgi:hypothetical protein
MATIRSGRFRNIEELLQEVSHSEAQKYIRETTTKTLWQARNGYESNFTQKDKVPDPLPDKCG